MSGEILTRVVPGGIKDHDYLLRLISTSLNRVIDGKLNSTGSVTLTTSAASTTVTDFRTGNESVILLMPLTANAAAEVANGTIYIATQTASTSFVITHANNAQADRSFRYVIVG